MISRIAVTNSVEVHLVIAQNLNTDKTDSSKSHCKPSLFYIKQVNGIIWSIMVCHVTNSPSLVNAVLPPTAVTTPRPPHPLIHCASLTDVLIPQRTTCQSILGTMLSV